MGETHFGTCLVYIIYLFVNFSQDILNSIVEQGAAFKELEYRNIINLLHRSSPAFDQKTLTQWLKKLEEIMTEAV